VGDLAAFSRADLIARFGEQQGAFLAALPLAQVSMAGLVCAWCWMGGWLGGWVAGWSGE